MKSLYHQKKRWSIGGLKAPWQGYVIFVFGFLTNVLTLLTPFFFSQIWLYLVIFKITIDLFLLIPAYKRLGLVKDLKYFVAFELYYMIYVMLLLPIIFTTGKKVHWKGREY